MARPRGCPGQSIANRLVWLRAGCGVREGEQLGPEVKRLESHIKEIRLHLKHLRGFPCCYLLLHCSIFFSPLPFGKLEKREKQRKGGGVQREKRERKRDIPVPFLGAPP